MEKRNISKYIKRAAVIIIIILVAIVGVGTWHWHDGERSFVIDSEQVESKQWHFSGYVMRNGERQPVKVCFDQNGTECKNGKLQDIKANETVDMEVTKGENSIVLEGMKNGITYRVEMIKSSKGSSWGGSLQTDSQTMPVTLYEDSRHH